MLWRGLNSRGLITGIIINQIQLNTFGGGFYLGRGEGDVEATNVMIDHKCNNALKCNKTGKCYPNCISSNELCPRYKLDKNKHLGTLSKVQNFLLHLIERAPPQISLASKSKRCRSYLSKNTIFLLYLINRALQVRVAHERKKIQ